MSNFISDYQLPHYQLSISIVLWDYGLHLFLGLWSVLVLWFLVYQLVLWSEGGDDQGVGTVYY